MREEFALESQNATTTAREEKRDLLVGDVAIDPKTRICTSKLSI